MRSNVDRRTVLKGLGGIFGAAALPAELASALSPSNNTSVPNATDASSRKPNILWITGEGISTEAISCYGGRLMPTPNIDRIAKEGMRFENSFVTNALCAPGRATLLTGKYSNLNGMVSNPDNPAACGVDVPHFDAAQETFPKILKQNGYQTGVLGKWHLPANPGETGFDYFLFKVAAPRKDECAAASLAGRR